MAKEPPLGFLEALTRAGWYCDMNTRNALRPNRPLKVTPFEDKLLRNAKQLFQMSCNQNWYYHSSPQQQLSHNAAALLKKILAQGTVEFLVRTNQGWWESFLQHGQEKSGRLWERHLLHERTLHFSTNTLNILIWWTSTDPKMEQEWREPPVDVDALTPADELIIWRIADYIHSVHGFRSNSFSQLCSLNVFRSNPWLWLYMPHLLEIEISQESTFRLDEKPWYAKAKLVNGPSFASCFQGLRSVILEALQSHLSQHLVTTLSFLLRLGTYPQDATDKRDLKAKPDVKELTRWNAATYLIYRQFLLDAEQAERPDLAMFLLCALTCLQDRSQNNDFDEEIRQLPTVQERIEARQALIAPLALIDILHHWTLNSRNIGYWDEGYRMAQWWLRHWEALRGDECVSRVCKYRQTTLPPAIPKAESNNISNYP